MSNLKSEVYEFGVFSPGGILINNFLLPLFGISFLFYGLIYEKTFISKILGSNIFIIMGKSSYIFYLIHMGVIMSLVKSFSNNFIIDFVVIIIISIFMFKYLEEPLNIFIRNFFNNKN
jgi:peptidoglycan/LPS O-acetylase OafA/YrhL